MQMKIRIKLTEAKKPTATEKAAKEAKEKADKKAAEKASKEKHEAAVKAENKKKKAAEKKKAEAKKKLKESLYPVIANLIKESEELEEKMSSKEKMEKGLYNETDDAKLEEGDGGLTDPNFIAGVATLLGVGSALLIPYIKQLRKAKTPEEKAKVRADMSKAISDKMSGGM